MTHKFTFHIQTIIDEYNRKKVNNPRYSKRAYAKFLGIDQSTLSSIIKGKRDLPVSYVESFIAKLGLNSSDAHEFRRCATLKSVKLDNIPTNKSKSVTLSLNDFKKISSVDAYSIMGLLKLETFKYDIGWISNVLKIPQPKVTESINDLIELGLAYEKEGKLLCTNQITTTTDEIPSESISDFHQEVLKEASLKVKELPPEKRYFSTLTVPSNIEHLPEFKLLAKEFEDKVEALLEDSFHKKDLIRLSIQSYPVFQT